MLTDYSDFYIFKSIACDIDENKHIIALKFDSIEKEDEIFGALFKGKVWKDIPELAVITGRNGVGKSQLLKYMHQVLEEYELNTIYRSVTHEDSINSEDSYYDHSYLDTDERDKVVSSILEYFKNTTTSEILGSNIKLINTKAGVLKILRKKYKDKLDSIDRIKINNAINSYIEPRIRPHNLINPLEVLFIVLNSYHERHNKLIEEYEEYLPDLIQSYYETHPKESEKDAIEFFKSPNNRNESLQFIQTYFTTILKKTDPLRRINKILKKYKFTYTIDFIYQDKKFFFKRGKDRFEGIDSLSSGEKMALNILTWQYCYESIDDSQIGKLVPKTHIMILDEPDKHLDPKLCALFFKLVREVYVEKLKIQVIMTTHRTDTLALAPEGSIFSIEKNTSNKVCIKPSTKLNAIFHLTPNMRSLVNFDIRVHVEAPDDVIFYDTTYRVLTNYCNTIRDHNLNSGSISPEERFSWQKIKEHIGDDSEPWQYRTLSRRYRLTFHSTSIDAKGSGGGCDGVKDSVSRGYYSGIDRKSKIGSLFIDSKAELPFGIIDKDLPDTKKEKSETPDNKISERIVTLKRHSIENYLYDPFILCSVLSETKLEELSNNESESIQQIVSRLSNGGLEYEEVRGDETSLYRAISFGLYMKSKDLNDYPFLKNKIKELPLRDMDKDSKDAAIKKIKIEACFEFLKDKISSMIDNDPKKFLEIIRSFYSGPKTAEDYLNRVKQGIEQDANLDKILLAEILNRPIITIQSDGTYKVTQELTSLTGDPMFVHCKEENYYSALVLSDSNRMDGKAILKFLKESNADEESCTFKDACLEIKRLLKDSKDGIDREMIGPLRFYFLFLLNRITDSDIKKLDEKKLKDPELSDFIAAKRAATESRSVILNNEKIIEIQYPVPLLYCKGHDIGSIFHRERSALQKKLIESLLRVDDDFPLPLDLAEALFELNDKARTQVRKIIKPGCK